MLWHDLLRAAALMLVLEGILPFLAPARAKAAYASIAGLDERLLRRLGVAAMLSGLASLRALHWLA